MNKRKFWPYEGIVVLFLYIGICGIHENEFILESNFFSLQLVWNMSSVLGENLHVCRWEASLRIISGDVKSQAARQLDVDPPCFRRILSVSRKANLVNGGSTYRSIMHGLLTCLLAFPAKRPQRRRHSSDMNVSDVRIDFKRDDYWGGAINY